MSLTHLDVPSARNQALVSGRELLLATPTANVEARLRRELGLSSSFALRGLLEGDDEAYLEWAAEHLQHMTKIPFVMVGELSGEDWDRVQTIELRTPEGRGENFEYDLLGTPCSNVIGQMSCIYPAGVAELFPDDLLLAQMGIESYIGLPLFDRGGRPLGVLVLLDQRPWSQAEVQETLGLMVAFRPRLEAILATRRMQRDLELLSDQLALTDDEDPLARLVASFAHAMNVRGAFVSRPAGGKTGSMRTVARIMDGQTLPDVEYELAGSPLAELDVGAEVLVGSELYESWPAARELASFEAKACLALSLVSADGSIVGQLGLLHDRPLNRRIGEQPVVGAFRRQIAFELRRQRLEAERLATERRMQELQRTESLGILAGGVAHDFNNLLVGMLGNADLALLDVSEGGSEELRESLVDIRDAARSATQLCRQMLAYAGRAKVESRRFELGAELGELSRLLSASISRNIEVRIERSIDEAWIDGDLVQIRQVMMNLITNAGDAIGEREGSICVTIDRLIRDEAGPPVLTVGGALEPGSYVRVRVRDDGCGMDEETRSRIFDPFFTTKHHGHGLGLAAILGTIKSHGGAVAVSSCVGAGTCFTVYLAEAEAEAEAEAPGASAEPTESTTPPICILVVDDDPGVRKVASRMLARAGYQVITATDGLEAISCYEREGAKIDCVLLDLNMPRLDGVEAMKRLRELSPQLPVIISSGCSDRVEFESDASPAASAVVHKPYEVKQLLSAVDELLSAAPRPTQAE